MNVTDTNSPAQAVMNGENVHDASYQHNGDGSDSVDGTLWAAVAAAGLLVIGGVAIGAYCHSKRSKAHIGVALEDEEEEAAEMVAVDGTEEVETLN